MVTQREIDRLKEKAKDLYDDVLKYRNNEARNKFDEITKQIEKKMDEFNAQGGTKTVRYSIGARPLGDWDGEIEIPTNATDNQIQTMVEDACEFYLHWEIVEDN